MPQHLFSETGGGGQRQQHPPPACFPRQARHSTNSRSLLYQLLRQQGDVERLPRTKLESGEVKTLISSIADVSVAGADKLEEFFKRDSAPSRERIPWSRGETPSSDTIVNALSKERLMLSDSISEFELLLMQAEALSYAWHLAKVTAEIESRPDRAVYLEHLGAQMRDLHHRAILLLRSSICPAKPTIPDNRISRHQDPFPPRLAPVP